MSDSYEIYKSRGVVYVASPYTKGDKEGNVARQIHVAHQLMEYGYVPYLPLLSHYIDQHHPRPWKDWMKNSFEILGRCDVVLRLPGESVGADMEVMFANYLGIQVYYDLDDFLLL